MIAAYVVSGFSRTSYVVCGFGRMSRVAGRAVQPPPGSAAGNLAAFLLFRPRRE
jgi:hypothetical protein